MPKQFLRHPLILYAMFWTGPTALQIKKLEFVEATLGPAADRMLEEDPVGDPFLSRVSRVTSSNLIHHCFHIANFHDATGESVTDLSVTEWGGGYGSLARAMFKLAPRPYVLIDTPLFSMIQWLYLSSVFGEDAVEIVTDDLPAALKPKFYLLSLNLWEKAIGISDLFISTWALSESSRTAQDNVSVSEWFGAKHLLLAFQENSRIMPDAKRLGDLVEVAGASVQPIAHQPGNYYAFR